TVKARYLCEGLLVVLLLLSSASAQDPQGPQLPEIKLLQAGKEPHVRLRYHIKPGDRETMILAMKSSYETEVAGQKMPKFLAPTIEQTMQIDVTEVKDDKVSYVFKITDIKVLDDEAVPAPVRAAMTEMSAKAVGLEGTATVDDRGRTIA